MAKNETKEKDLGAARILKEMAKLEKQPFVKTGLPAEGQDTEANHEDSEGLTNLDLGFIHEFGNPDQNIPERSHVRAAFDNNKKDLQKMTDTLAGKILDGKETVESSLDKIGLKKVANIQNLVRSGEELEELSETTKKIRLKKTGDSDPTPLIDTAQYLNSITSVKKMEKESDFE